ncbi:hypothetical protein DFH29DRAFT_448808 [Suillus ampliporus]|nr:hypothetical protein DFH29DRAFT_448808 [Suillus ampliporus]
MEYSADDIAAAKGLQAFTYTYTSMATFWTYDYACSLHEEWMFLHRSRWTKVKGLYIVTRYLPFSFLTLNLYRSFVPNENPGTCLTLANIGSGVGLISIACSGCFFVLRTYALWNDNIIVLAVMLSTFFASIAASIGTSFKALSTHVVTSAIPDITGCYHTSNSLVIPYVLAFVLQLGLALLTLIRAIQVWRMASSPLYVVLVKHSIFYYACGLFLSTLNVLALLLFSYNVYHTIFEDLQFFILPMLATRMHLYLWQIEQHVHSSDALGSDELSALVFISMSNMSSAGGTA